MKSEQLVKEWFTCWQEARIDDLPITEDFIHQSPFGKIEGKSAYLNLVNANREKFLGYEFEIQDALYQEDKACVRYLSRQGDQFELAVSEWYYLRKGHIAKVMAYYHIGKIREERES